MATKNNEGITPSYFIYIIDKFFKEERNFVCLEIDNEFKEFIIEEDKRIAEF